MGAPCTEFGMLHVDMLVTDPQGVQPVDAADVLLVSLHVLFARVFLPLVGIALDLQTRTGLNLNDVVHHIVIRCHHY